MSLMNYIKDGSFKFLIITGIRFFSAVVRLFDLCGLHLLRKHYYSPIPTLEELGFQHDSPLIGIDMNESVSFALLGNVLDKYKREFNSFPNMRAADTEFYLLNGSFMAIDGNVYYSLVREMKPRRIVEVGSGNSTLLAMQAISMNVRETGIPSELICIEPNPSHALRQASPRFITLLEKPVQAVGMELFLSLGSNDILFIDSTHVMKSGGGCMV